MVNVSQHAVETWVLTPEGDAFAEHGSPEFRVWAACAGEAGKSIKDLQAELGADVVKIGQLNAFKRKWISKRGDVFVQNVCATPCLLRLWPATCRVAALFARSVRSAHTHRAPPSRTRHLPTCDNCERRAGSVTPRRWPS